jgi:hypothetical protein
MADAVPTPLSTTASSRRTWALPKISELPKLTDLTLASAIGGGGGTGGGGSTVFGLLLAVGLIAGCSSNELTEPTTPPMPMAVAAVQCVASVPAKQVLCGGPLSAPGQEIIGGQGTRVILRSSNVLYAGTDFTFDVSVQNIGAQGIGTDGNMSTGVRVFFETGPQVTGGAGSITVEDDSTGTFTAAGQSYYVYPDSLGHNATSPTKPWRFSVDNSVTTFTFEVLIAADVGDAGGVLRWQAIEALGYFSYNDVAWSGPNDAMAVGDFGHAKRWNGATWTPLTPVTGVELNAVAAIAPGEYLAVGDSGKIFRSKGKIWTEIHATPIPAVSFQDVWVRDANHFFAVGSEGGISSYINGAWTDYGFGGSPYFMTVAGSRDGAITGAVTDLGDLYTSVSDAPFAFDQNIWPDVLIPGTIAYDDDGTLIKSYIEFNNADGLVIRGASDTLFKRFAVLAQELMIFGADSMLALADNWAESKSVLMKVRYGGFPISSFPISDTLFGQVSEAARLDSAGTTFAAISCSCDQGLVVWSGSSYAPVEDGFVGPFYATWGQGDTVWMADYATNLWKVVNGTTAVSNGIAGATDLWGFSGTELYVIADSTVWRGDGAGNWTFEARLGGGNADFRSIWGDPGSGTLLVTGDNGRYMQRVGGVWSEPTFGIPGGLGVNLREVWGCSASQAWIGSSDGQIWNWTPSGATQDMNYTGVYGAWPIKAFAGGSCSDVWAGGPSNALFHWNGTTWDSLFVTGDQLNIDALAYRDADAVYAGGESGLIASVTATGTVVRMAPNSQGDFIRSLWRLDNGDLVVGGDFTVMLGRR